MGYNSPMEPERVINLVRKYGTPDFRIYSSDEFFGVHNLFIEIRRCRISILGVGMVFDATYLQHEGYPYAKVDPAGVVEVSKFRPGKWVDRLEDMANRIEKKKDDDKFSPVRDWWMFRGR